VVTLTHVIYGLHAFSLVTGIITAASIVGAFLDGLALDHRRHPELREAERGARDVGSRRTSGGRSARSGSGYCGWRSACSFVVATLGVGLLIAWLPLGVVGLWFIYRVVSGWLRLKDRRPM